MRTNWGTISVRCENIQRRSYQECHPFEGHIDDDLGEASVIWPGFTTATVSSLIPSGLLTP
jgi:hypothetical protein